MKHFKISLPWQILIAIVFGVLFGLFLYDYIDYVSWIGTMFLRALKMIIIPLVFSSLVIGVSSMGKSSDLGRIAGKTILYYVCTTLVAIIIGVVLVNIFKPGVGANIPLTESVDSVPVQNGSFIDTLINVVPSNIVESMAKGELLPVIFFSLLLGVFITS